TFRNVEGAKVAQSGIGAKAVTALELQEPAAEARVRRIVVVHGDALDDHDDLRDSCRDRAGGQPVIREGHPGESGVGRDDRRDVAHRPFDVVRVRGAEGTLLDAHADRQRAAYLDLHYVPGPHILHVLLDVIDVDETEYDVSMCASH